MTNLPFVSVYVRADDDMLNRRGGIKYIFGEIKFRILILKYISFWKYPENLLCALFRILVFSSPIFLKRLMYKIKRNFSDHWGLEPLAFKINLNVLKNINTSSQNE